MKTAKILVLALVAVGLVSCSGGISSKEDAATVVQRLGAMGAGSTSSVTQGLTSAFKINNNVDVTGKSGTAKASVELDWGLMSFSYIVLTLRVLPSRSEM